MTAAAADYIEPSYLEARVAKGMLAPVGQRLPSHPYIETFTQTGRSPGRYGGDLRLLMGRSSDIRLMVVMNRVCDSDLRVARDLHSHRLYREEFFKAAVRTGNTRWYHTPVGLRPTACSTIRRADEVW